VGQKTVHVLLIEDDPVAAGVLEAQLAADFSTRYEPVLVGNLSAGIERLKRGSFDIVVLDLLLPDARGLDALRQVMDVAGDLPIVVLTSLDDEEVAAKALQQGAQDYLVKGEIHGRLMARSIRYAIERQRLNQALRGLALVDEQTGLYNRRGFASLAEQQLSGARRSGRGVALISVALEESSDADLPTVDAQGEAPTPDSETQSHLLKRLVTVLRETFRASDLLTRVGEREFLVLAVQNGRDGARAALSRFQKSLDAPGPAAATFSVRIGLDWIEPTELPSADALLDRYESLDGPTRELHLKGSLVVS
jgi:PleD family two-component response regulator